MDSLGARLREQRHDRGVQHVRPRGPVREFRVPARDRAIVVRNSRKCIRPGCGWRILIQIVLENAL